jgi:hypothetical protein
MKNVTPKFKTTETSPDMREWVPSSFDNFFREVEYLVGNCDGADPIPLYRGHADYQWKLDCTLVRTLLAVEYTYAPPYPRPVSFHTKVVDILLEKFGKFWQPSSEAFEKELRHGIDPWFELMKRFQQYTEEDSEPKGTFLIDWTTDWNIALYFATYTGRGTLRALRASPGALWIWDPVSTEKVLQTKRLEEILSLLRADAFRIAANHSAPLILHPEKQTRMLRSVGQKPVYVSQMDYRCDLADVWAGIENASSSVVFKKIILADTLLQECATHLRQQGIGEDTVYPE